MMMFKLMKVGQFLYLIVALTILGFSCDEEISSSTEAVLISDFNAPTNAKVGDTIEINLSATANNGCWSNLVIHQNKMDDFNIYFSAKGEFSGAEICPMVLVTKDSIFTIQPSKEGIYFLYINDSPFEQSIHQISVE